jgi:diguanylate cyclase (GGDEF)-like protein
MEGMTLKSRAIAFAFCTGAVAFILALLAGAQSGVQDGDLSRALILAIVCGIMSWASAERAIAGYAEAVDDSIARLARAAEGDLSSPTPSSVARVLPELAHSLDGLLSRVRSNLDSVHTLAMHDPVTQLPNRTWFRAEASRLLDEAPPDRLVGLFFIDLDKFKAVNDTFGHAQGDQLLIKVAERLRQVIAPVEGAPAFALQPLIGRLAGDEFTMLVPELGSRDEAERVGDALLDALSEPYELAGQIVEVGASIGVALRPDQGHSLTELMRAADVAMYHAKESGRGQCQLFTPSLAARLADNVRLERELRDAIDRKEFAFLFQPQICLTSGSVRAAEAVLRWRHPTLGMLSPRAFVSRAEESGLIHEIGYWAVEQLAVTLGDWERRGMTTRVAVNISARQLARSDFFAQVRHAMARHRTSADLLEIEIAESVAMQCEDAALAGLLRLREQGATIAIDEFGTGHSNFARLKNLPIDRVKIDRTLIADLAASDQARTIVQAVIALVHGLGFSVTAEGVESAAQRTILQVAGCDVIQGSVVAKPMDQDELLDWLREEDWKRAQA